MTNERWIMAMMVLVYLLICMAIGIWASRRTHSAADFFVAGKSIGVWVLGLAAFSTTASGFAFIGGPGIVYQYGASSLWICVAASISFVWAGATVAKRLCVISDVFPVMTMGDAMEFRFQSRACRLIASLVILLGVIAYLGTQISAMGTVAETFLEISRGRAILLGVGVIVFYSVVGGIIAGLYTDVFQGGIMVFAALAVFYLALTTAGDGSFLRGPANITTAILQSETPQAIGPWGLVGPWMCLSWFFLFSFGGAGQPHLITKYFMVRRTPNIRQGIVIAAVAYFLCSLLWISVGFTMKRQALVDPTLALAAPDHAAPIFLLRYAPQWLAGLVFAGLLAAIMSTADAFVNLGAAVFVHDLPRVFGRPAARHELGWARGATLIIALLATVFAWCASDALVVVLGVLSWGVFAVPLAPVVAIGFHWPRATWQGAFVSMSGGLALYLILELITRYPTGQPWYAIPHGVPPGAVGLAVSTILLIVVSWVTPTPQLDPKLAVALQV